jgi:hypothetical protein
MLELYQDSFASRAFEQQPIYEPAAVRTLLATLGTAAPEDRFGIESVLQRVLSTTFLHQRFAMGS